MLNLKEYTSTERFATDQEIVDQIARHILIKLLRHQDKVEIMKNRKESRKDDNY